MKILINIAKNDFRFIGFSKALESTESNCVFVTGDLPKQVIDAVKPDLIIHNNPQIQKIGSIPTMYLSQDQYSKFGPFTILNNSKVKDRRFESDISYVGDLELFNSSLDSFLCADYDIKIFSNKAISVYGYWGSVSKEETYHVYNQAKVCPIPQGDEGYRELDIIAADGNPVHHNGNLQEFIQNIKDGINGKKFNTTSKEDVINTKTNFDFAGNFMRELSLKKIAGQIQKAKKAML